MKNLFKIIFIILTYLILINFSFANIQNKIIANIGNQIITSHELKNKIITNLILNNQEVNQSNVNNDKQSALRSLVNYKLKKNEINRVKISTNLDDVFGIALIILIFFPKLLYLLVFKPATRLTIFGFVSSFRIV